MLENVFDRAALGWVGFQNPPIPTEWPKGKASCGREPLRHSNQPSRLHNRLVQHMPRSINQHSVGQPKREIKQTDKRTNEQKIHPTQNNNQHNNDDD